MNQCIVHLLKNSKLSNKLVSGLPIAFEQAELEMPSNPAVGLLREHILIGFFKNAIGSDKIQTAQHGNQRSHDLTVCGEKLSIKTIKKNGGIKVLWTVDQDSIANETLAPDCDIFLVQLWWDQNKPSIFYIPLVVQNKICDRMGSKNYHKYPRSGTNNRGVELSSKAVNLLITDSATIGLRVNWRRHGLNDTTPYKRWEDFWQQHN